MTYCKAYLGDIWFDAYATEVFENGLVHVLVFDGDLVGFETDVPVWRVR